MISVTNFAAPPYDVLDIAGWAGRTRIACHDAIAASVAVPDGGIDLAQNEALVLVSIA